MDQPEVEHDFAAFPAYERMSDRYLGSLSPFSRDARMMKRRFHASSSDESLDSAGRVRLPNQMVDRAGLAGTCVVVGAGSAARAGVGAPVGSLMTVQASSGALGSRPFM